MSKVVQPDLLDSRFDRVYEDIEQHGTGIESLDEIRDDILSILDQDDASDRIRLIVWMLFDYRVRMTKALEHYDNLK